MKFLSAQLVYFFRNRSTRRNVRALLRFIGVLTVMVVIYSVLFHYIAAAEGQQHSWITGFYWTFVTMTTLGFGDITFQGDLGRAFSVLVLLSGVLFLLVLLPFAFIQFFYAPWIEARSQMRAPRELPEGTRGHVILTAEDPVARSLMARLASYGRPYVLLVPEVARALELYDEGIPVMVGSPEDLESYRRLRAADAAMVVATGNDFLNTNIAFTVRELTSDVSIVATVRAEESEDILGLAGSSHVLRLTDMLGRSLARRTLGGVVRANEIGRFGELRIAEAPASGTPLVGKTLRESRLREVTGLTVVGLWERGRFGIPHPDTRIQATTVLVLAGSAEQMAAFNELTCIYNWGDAPVLILGGGRVGRAAAAALQEREVEFRIVEKDAARIRPGPGYVQGSAADLKTLERAGIHDASSVIVTTNDDATNIYLTIYCRRLNPGLQIVSRATLDRNVSTLHRAGADFVMSYASMGANAIFNVLEGGDVVMLAEGLDVFRVRAPGPLRGRPLIESGIRAATGCSVVALESGGQTLINPPPDARITPDSELILIGTVEGEQRFIRHFRQ